MRRHARNDVVLHRDLGGTGSTGTLDTRYTRHKQNLKVQASGLGRDRKSEIVEAATNEAGGYDMIKKFLMCWHHYMYSMWGFHGPYSIARNRSTPNGSTHEIGDARS